MSSPKLPLQLSQVQLMAKWYAIPSSSSFKFTDEWDTDEQLIIGDGFVGVVHVGRGATGGNNLDPTTLAP